MVILSIFSTGILSNSIKENSRISSFLVMSIFWEVIFQNYFSYTFFYIKTKL